MDILDVSNPKIQNAMKTLGITESEIKHKSLQDFYSPDISKDIQQLRYDHHISKTNSLASKIKDFICHQSFQNESQNSKNNTSTSTYPQNYLFTVDKIKVKYNKRLLNFLENERSSRILEEELYKKTNRDHVVDAKIQETIEDHKKKTEEKFTKNRENLKSLYLEQKNYRDDLLERMNKSSLSPMRLFTSEKAKRSVIRTNSLDDNEIDDKLQEINRKFLKSSQNYARNLQNKIESLQTNRKRKNSIENIEVYTHKLQSISEKYENAVHRREKIKQEFNEKVTIKENKNIEKTEKIRDLIQKDNKKLNEKSKNIEEKELKVMDFLVTVKKKQQNKIEIMQEKKKLIENDVTENINRMKKLEEQKKEKILEKHLQIEKKKNEHTEHLENINQKIREKAMNFTIEREKLAFIKAQISKTQSPTELKKLLEKYQNLSK